MRFESLEYRKSHSRSPSPEDGACLLPEGWLLQSCQTNLGGLVEKVWQSHLPERKLARSDLGPGHRSLTDRSPPQTHCGDWEQSIRIPKRSESVHLQAAPETVD